MDKNILRRLQELLAVRTLPDSVRHGHGAGSVARTFCASLPLGQLGERHGGRFLSRLEASTVRRRRAPSPSGRSWGAAREVLNLFLREAHYNGYLCGHYHLERAEGWLELPLDTRRARRLLAERPGSGLPPWRGVKTVTSSMNSNCQGLAVEVAEQKGVAHVHLDVIWRRSR